MDSFVIHPEEGGPFPAVVVLMDIWGLREELFEVTVTTHPEGRYTYTMDMQRSLRPKVYCLFFPSPLVGEGGIGGLRPPFLERRCFASAMAPDEGYLSSSPFLP